MIRPERLSARTVSISLPTVVHQHATPECARTPMITATMPVHRDEAGLQFALGSVSALPDPSLPDFAPHSRQSAAH
jgi:hypothetical protein